MKIFLILLLLISIPLKADELNSDFYEPSLSNAYQGIEINNKSIKKNFIRTLNYFKKNLVTQFLQSIF